MSLDDLGVLVSQALTLYWLQKKTYLKCSSIRLSLAVRGHVSELPVAGCSFLLCCYPDQIYSNGVQEAIFPPWRNSGPPLRVRSSTVHAGTVQVLMSVKPLMSMGKREGMREIEDGEKEAIE